MRLIDIFLEQVFRITSGYVELNPAFRDYEERTVQVEQVLQTLRTEKAFFALKGWRNEVMQYLLD